MNRIRYSILLAFFSFLVGCSNDDITEEDLIGGEWEVIAGYSDGDPEGTSYCSSGVDSGLEFKDEETVYSQAYERDVYYKLVDLKEGLSLYIEAGLTQIYYIEKINEDEFGLRGVYDDQNCYFKRQ
ncbi:hypothetical protein [Oceanobacillus sp. CFH 90083]|uniref:hypothetical protein n=1 Tax=Oceanobacillus sp. CFH 90083 TaxID=2592336 RepID=UPI00128CA42F|nr:hypothetical protein [Oceanobacillus sp. CFH 90083]